VEPIGSTQIVHCALDGDDPSALIAVVPAELHLEEDSTVGVEFPPEAIHLFRSEDGARLQARPAE
jgi:multiple sugar transport system ATP-binding protein